MAHFLFLTWDGAGNQPPAVAVAAALKGCGHAVTFAGYEHQRSYFAGRDFRFVLLRRAAAKWRNDNRERMFAIKLDSVWAASAHLDDVPELMQSEDCDAVIIDCLMFGALAASEKLRIPTAAFVHSAPGALMPPGGTFETQLLGAVNRLRQQAKLSSLDSLWEAWARFPALHRNGTRKTSGTSGE